MWSSILKKFLGSHHEREMKQLQPILDKINSLEPQIKKLDDKALREKTDEFRNRWKNGESLESLLPEAFAVCREAGLRVLKMRHYDVQIICGIILSRGAIAEMKTGEGKTLVATLPMYLHGLTGRGAHLVTVNDYLAARDCEWMGKLYHFLGLTTGTIVADISDEERQSAYAADITYGTNNEFGFDYLRDNMKFDLSDYAQRELNFAIVDECDSILIDEARTPLIISGPSEDSVDKYYEVNKIIPKLKQDKDFSVEEKTKSATLTEEGNKTAETLLGIGNLYDIQNIDLLHHIYQGLKAHHLFKLDADYVIQNDEIIIVDEFTGRLMSGRRWSDGLHQAIEAKEGVSVKSENQTLASITFQNYFKMYKTFSGMTGTADTEAVEFKKIYDLSVSVIPTNKPIARLDSNDVIYKTEQAKYLALAVDIKERSLNGQPILVGTTNIDKSERLSNLLKKEGIKHYVLNAKFHEKEAELVAQAGRLSRVTIATNMAGRGTDIVLGGNPESLAQLEFKSSDKSETEESFIKKYSEICKKEKQQVLQAGGLYIIGTERHESRRIDNQLRGRSGRQGDKGATRFYLSLEDDLMRIFNGERIQKIMNTLNLPDDEPIEAKMISRAIEGAQKKVEGYNFDMRKHLLDYDNVMNKQRHSIYSLRREVLKGDNLDQLILDMLSEVTSVTLDNYVPEDVKPSEWNLPGLTSSLNRIFNLKLNINQGSVINDITDQVSQSVKQAFDKRKVDLKDDFAYMQQMICLQSIDNFWKSHLAQMDKLREGINLRAYAQKDPLIEYKKEAFQAFSIMNFAIKEEVIEKLMKVQLVDDQELQDYFEQQQELLKDGQQLEGADDPDLSNFVQRYKQNSKKPLKESDNQSQDENMNRADRRRLKKQQKK
ncbi:MAG: preprotein translocase subunit SecA [Bdellovibrionales bacterium]|nr:preprotein translocase subunit SecA [Bdellovibrionales bacterium]